MEINNFVYYNPTKIYFGDQQLSHLAEEVKKHGEASRQQSAAVSSPIPSTPRSTGLQKYAGMPGVRW